MKVIDKRDKVYSFSPGRKVLMDGIDLTRKPDGYGVCLVDLTAAKKFIEHYEKEKNIWITYLHLIIKACALALKKYPGVNYMMSGYKVVEPSTIDIGVSVAGEENIAPVVVIREADTKSLYVIVEEFMRKARKAKKQESENLRKLDRIVRWVPFNHIRRKLVSLAINSGWFKREMVGTFQITTLNFKGVDFILPAVLTTTGLLGVGGVAKRCIGVKGKIELRPTVYLSFQMDHRLLDGKKSFSFMREVKRLLENPDGLND